MMPDRGKYIEVLSNAVKKIKESNEDIPIKISLECIEDILKLLKEQDNCEDCAIAIEDRQPVVRCRDCKYCGSEIRDGIKFAKCELKHNWMPQVTWFCADGVRK